MKLAITGSTGLIGNSLTDFFSNQGHIVTRVVRDPNFKDPKHPVVIWNPVKKEIDLEKLENQDVFIHLAGDNIGSGRWTVRRKQEIKDSRIEVTTFLSDTIASLKKPPKLFFSASAIGFYGNHDHSDPIDETYPSPSGFLPELCRNWELATSSAAKSGIRVVNMRFGIVLSPKGGALAKMLPAFKLGLGGKIGSGKQIMSWISLEEIPLIILHLIEHPAISGPVNFVSPHSVANTDFTRILGQVLKRPTVFPLPELVVKIIFGEMGEELLLGGANIIPKKLQTTGYNFSYPELQKALSLLLN